MYETTEVQTSEPSTPNKKPIHIFFQVKAKPNCNISGKAKCDSSQESPHKITISVTQRTNPSNQSADPTKYGETPQIKCTDPAFIAKDVMPYQPKNVKISISQAASATNSTDHINSLYPLNIPRQLPTSTKVSFPLLHGILSTEKQMEHHKHHASMGNTLTNWNPNAISQVMHKVKTRNYSNVVSKKYFENKTIDSSVDRLGLSTNRNKSTIFSNRGFKCKDDENARVKCSYCKEKDKYICELQKMVMKEKNDKLKVSKELEEIENQLNKGKNKSNGKNVFIEYVHNLKSLEQENSALKTKIKENRIDDVYLIVEKTY